MLDLRDGTWRIEPAWRPSVDGGRLSDLLAAQVRTLDAESERDALELIALAEVLTLAEAQRLVGAPRSRRSSSSG